MTDLTDPTDLLRRAESHLSALHGSVARHDNLAANLSCAGCQLRDEIRAALSAVPAPPAADQTPLAAALTEVLRGFRAADTAGLVDAGEVIAFVGPTVTPEDYKRWCDATVAPPAADRADLRRRFGEVLRRWGLLDEVNDPKAAEEFAVTDLLAVLAEHGQDERAAEPPLSPDYEHPECGFRWHGRDGMDIPMRDGQPICPRCEIERLRERHKASLRRADQINNELMEEVQRYAIGAERPVLWSVYNRMHSRAATAEAEVKRLRRLADETQQPTGHVYLSTGCWHGDQPFANGLTGHEYCQGRTGILGAKKPAQCKGCGAGCVCGCHQGVEAQPEPHACLANPDRAADEAQFGVEGCTCIPFTRQDGAPRYCGPTDTVDMISGWEIGRDCLHHKAAVEAQQGEETTRG